ncbi:MAG: hypothetical protein R2939_05695 [Kofleriaceae bacterium]
MARPDLAPRAFELPAAVPDVRWYDTAEFARDAAAAWRRVAATPPGTVAVLEAGQVEDEIAAALGRVDAEGQPTVDGRAVDVDGNTLRVEIDAPGHGVVVINELWHRRGWRATVDGAPAPIYAANGFARAVVVDAGPHTIVLRYSADGYLAGAALALLAWVGLAAVGIHTWRRRRRAAAEAACSG